MGMPTEHNAFVADLDPPPGGVEQFRRRLDEAGGTTRSPIGRWALVGAAASALAVALVTVLQQQPQDDPAMEVASVYEAREFDRLLGRPMEPAEFSISINNEPVSVSETPTMNSKIRIYEIERD